MSGWNKNRTSLQEVGGSLYRVMRVICRQCNVDHAEGDGIEYNTNGYKGEYKLSFPQDWDANAVTMVKVESCVIAGIPSQWVRAGNDIELQQDTPSVCKPRSFAIRSNALGAGGTTLEAKRWRGDIVERTSGAALPAYTKAGAKYDVETTQSNVLQMIPNQYNFTYQDIKQGGMHSNTGSENTNGLMGSPLAMSMPLATLYGIQWNEPVNLNTCGTTIGYGNGQTQFDLYITNNYDYPQNKTNPDGVVFEPRLLLATTLSADGDYVYDPVLSTDLFPTNQLHNPIPYETGQSAGWDIVLVFYQLADSPRN